MSDRDTKSPTDVDRRIGASIRARRIALGMSQTELGQAVGVTFQQIQKYEKGSNRISVGRLDQISSALGVADLSWFLKATTPPSTETSLSMEASLLLSAFARIEDRRVRKRILRLVSDLTRTVA